MNASFAYAAVLLLALGDRTLFDAHPLLESRVPLRAGVHYASMEIDRPPSEPASEVEYAGRHATPEAVGPSILGTLRPAA